MKKYSVTTPENLRSLCIRNNWFTEGTNRQYDKLFYANEHGATLDEIATIIWLCSDTSENGICRTDILEELAEENADYTGTFSGEIEGRILD
jgi:hypothetical protein